MRVHNLPDFVYFNHAIHVTKGVGCVSCHGRVDQMAAIEQAEPLTMSSAWTAIATRSPTCAREEVTSMTWQPEADPPAVSSPSSRRRHDVHSRTSCSTCHR